MHRNKILSKKKNCRKKQEKIKRLLSTRSSERDPETNVYIPTEDEVDELKAWGEFCKL